MNYAKYFALLILCVAGSARPIFRNAPVVPTPVLQNTASAPSFMSAEQLKAKIARNEPVTVIDVRDTETYLKSERIKDSIYIKLRRLSYRVTMPPLKDLPRDRDVVTYCACPHDEASIRAAQILHDAGFKRVHVLQGGWQMWVKVNGQVSPRPRA
jgi:rhodanese-related sulfurtransferase